MSCHRDRLNVYHPVRRNVSLALAELNRREEWETNKAREVALRAFYHKEQKWYRRAWRRIPVRVKFSFYVVVVFLLSWLFLLLWPAKADSLTVNQVAQELKQESPLSLRQNVASFWAQNLLTAQAQTGLNSLDLSIAAVLRAIGLEQTIAGLSFCNLTNCTIANAQSTVAIDPNAGSLTPHSLVFAPVATPEPGALLFLATGALWVFAVTRKRRHA